jgi:hypothetical protein
MSTMAAMTRVAWRLMPGKRIAKPVVHYVRNSRLMPRCWLRSYRAYRILSADYGHLLSTALMRSVDRAGEPLPWFTYPAIEFLRQLDLSGKRIFEYGCGGSTVYWSRVAAHVDSVEHVPEFHREISAALPSNCRLVLEQSPEQYINQIAASGQPYDVIVIDGHSRVRCATIAPQYLAPGGFIILDNADWFFEASALLRDADLIEVDMAGIAPINDFVHTTSFYFDRRYRNQPLRDRQPSGAIGSRPKPFFQKVVGPVSETPPEAAPRRNGDVMAR